VKVKRDGAEYDYDVVLPWGDYLFHFECKNHCLSGNDPKRAYHFLQEVGSSIRQIQRLRDGLVKWPDILTNEFGLQVTTKTVVHCLQHNETFSFPEGIDGIYIYDWSALKRFFEAAWFRVIHDHQGPQNTVFRNRVGVKRIWSGEEPAPTDLLEELANPSQYQIVMIAERFAVEHLRTAPEQKVWMVQTREGAGLGHFYASILQALRAPGGDIWELRRKAEQLDHLLSSLKPRMLIFDEFHNALRGRARDLEAVFAFLRRIGRQYDISPVLIGEVAVCDFVNATSEMASRFDLVAVPRWQYDETYLTLLDSLEAALPLAKVSDLSNEALARRIFCLSEGLIGEIVTIVTKAAIAAIRSGTERISKARIDELRHVPISQRRNSALRETLL
jgi:hypothetical protein